MAARSKRHAASPKYRAHMHLRHAPSKGRGRPSAPLSAPSSNRKAGNACFLAMRSFLRRRDVISARTGAMSAELVGRHSSLALANHSAARQPASSTVQRVRGSQTSGPPLPVT